MDITIKDLYQAMRHMQFELCCERAMRQVESSTKYEFIKLINDNYNQILIKCFKITTIRPKSNKSK